MVEQDHQHEVYLNRSLWPWETMVTVGLMQEFGVPFKEAKEEESVRVMEGRDPIWSDEDYSLATWTYQEMESVATTAESRGPAEKKAKTAHHDLDDVESPTLRRSGRFAALKATAKLAELPWNLNEDVHGPGLVDDEPGSDYGDDHSDDGLAGDADDDDDATDGIDTEAEELRLYFTPEDLAAIEDETRQSPQSRTASGQQRKRLSVVYDAESYTTLDMGPSEYPTWFLALSVEEKRQASQRALEDWTEYFERTKEQAMPWDFMDYDPDCPFFQRMLSFLKSEA